MLDLMTFDLAQHLGHGWDSVNTHRMNEKNIDGKEVKYSLKFLPVEYTSD